MNEIALTVEQQKFAADHHGLVYSFLNSRRLSEDDFYDIVVFGYLRAVKRYSDEPKARQYAFSTIAWREMVQSLSNYYKSLTRQKRQAYVISLDSVVYRDEEALLRYDVLSASDPLMADLETELLMLELASRVSKREMDIICMKADGYGIRAIAKTKKMSMKGVTELLASLRDTVLAVCYE